MIIRFARLQPTIEVLDNAGTVYSLDADIIHNPSSIDVWVRLNGETVHIPAGQTVRV